LALVLDEQRDGDEVIENDGLTFLVESALWMTAQPLRIDFTQAQQDAEYTVTSSIMESNTSVAESPEAWKPPACSLI
jgi:Fe-S cluster assembly iron-binding protein IscA